MDHFNITQECLYCMRGSKLFRVDLNCYDDHDGRLLIQPNQMEPFRFRCQFCHQTTTLDFYRFSHPDLICYLKRINKRYQQIKNLLQALYILINSI